MADSVPHDPDPRAAAHRDDAADSGAAKPFRRTLCLAGLLFLVSLTWASGHLERAAALGFQLFELYAQSQLAMLRAAGNVTDGRAEYAVLVDDSTSVAVLAAELEPSAAPKGRLDSMGSLRYERESALPGWIVVSVEDGDREAITALKSAAFARIVVPNRGLWICH